MKKSILLVAIFVQFTTLIWAQNIDYLSEMQKTDFNYFIQNTGQYPDEVLYLARLNGLDCWITKNGVVYDFFIDEASSKNNLKRLGHVVKFNMENVNENVKAENYKPKAGVYNYIVNKDNKEIRTQAQLLQEVVVKNIYEGIDIRYYFENNLLRYDFIVNPGANPSDIILKIEGTNNYYLNNFGDLEFETRFGKVKHAELFTYQNTKDKKNRINSKFQIINNRITFNIGNYNKTQPLIIDPAIYYGTYIGGNSEESIHRIIVDSQGNIIVFGTTSSANFPTTPGAYDQVFNDIDFFVSKFNSTLSQLIFSTFIGGSSQEGWGSALSLNLGMKTDDNGNIYCCGSTYSSNFPTTAGAYQTSKAGSYDGVVFKLSADGTSLLYSTFLGGSNIDDIFDIDLDNDYNVYVTGTTGSGNFPTTPGAINSTVVGYKDLFVSKLSSNFSQLVYSTIISANEVPSYGNGEYGQRIRVDSEGNAIVAGSSDSPDFPTTSGVIQTSSNGNREGIIFKVNSTGTGLLFSTYLGGSGGEDIFDMFIDNNNNIYVAGYTTSTNFPVTQGAFMTNYIGSTGYSNAFITKINADATNIVASTFVGGSGYDAIYSLSKDIFGNIYAMGRTSSSNFPISNPTFDETYSYEDAFIFKINSDLTTMLFSTFVGGSETEYGYTGYVDSNCNMYIAGRTLSNNFPTSIGCYDNTNDGTYYAGDAFVAKLKFCMPFDVSVSQNGNTLTANFSGTSYQWIDCNNNYSPISNATEQSFTPTQSGSYAVIITNQCCVDTSECITVNLVGIDNVSDKHKVNIYPNPVNNVLNIDFNGLKGTKQIYIKDILGRELYKLLTENYLLQINIDNLPNGLYFVEIFQNNNKISVDKIIK